MRTKKATSGIASRVSQSLQNFSAGSYRNAVKLSYDHESLYKYVEKFAAKMSALENVTHRVIQQQNGKSYSTFPHCLPIQQPHSAHSSGIHFPSCSSFSKKAQYQFW